MVREFQHSPAVSLDGPYDLMLLKMQVDDVICKLNSDGIINIGYLRKAFFSRSVGVFERFIYGTIYY